MTVFQEHRARKRFGQNFLVDDNVIRAISRAVHATAEDALIEIGPGQGALTAALLDDCPSLQVVELDRDLIPLLRDRFSGFADFKIHEGDALNFDFASLSKGRDLRIVGNLPYNISTPLIFRLLELETRVRDMHFMLQKEVVERLAASANTKSYGRLSVMAQYHCSVESLFDVEAHSFQPAPKVRSAVVRLQPYPAPPNPAENYVYFSEVVKLAFQQRRKTLRNALKSKLESSPGSTDIDLSRRGESLTVREFVKLSNDLNS